MKPSLNKLHLGASGNHWQDWVNVDYDDFDVTKEWPYESETFDVIQSDCLAAHLPPRPDPASPDPFDALMLEAARCLKPGGLLVLEAPNYRCLADALTDVDHHRLIGPRTFYHYWKEPDGERPVGSGGIYFEKPYYKPNLEKDFNPLFHGGPRIGKSDLPLLKHISLRLGLARPAYLQWHLKRNTRKYE